MSKSHSTPFDDLAGSIFQIKECDHRWGITTKELLEKYPRSNNAKRHICPACHISTYKKYI